MGGGAFAVALLLATSGGAPLEVVVHADAATAAALTKEAQAFWKRASAALTIPPPTLRVTIRPGERLPAGLLASSRPGGQIEVRLSGDGTIDERLRASLRHELVHQLLWEACPQSIADGLFHEAMAVVLSGELPLWREGPYLSAPAAAQTLDRAVNYSLDTLAARRALARLLTEQDGLPSALRRQMSRCADDAPWQPLTVEALTSIPLASNEEAFVVLSRHTYQLIEERGGAGKAMPFGSTLKPFVVAAARLAGKPLSAIRPAPQDPELGAQWTCGTDMPANMAAPEALARSCNGWFLAHGERDAALSSSPFGALAPLLTGSELSRLPNDMGEAIGLRSALTITPRGLAFAYAVLLDVDPGMADLLRDSRTLPQGSPLTGTPAKTGSVRDALSRPLLGWLVVATDDVIIVRAKPGVGGAALGPDVEAMRAAHRGRHLTPASVQVFGLVVPEAVEVECYGTALSITPGAPPVVLSTPLRLSSLSTHARIGCEAPWVVHVNAPGAAPGSRRYDGVFTWRPVETVGPVDPLASPRQQRARRGSDIIFTTTRGQYVQGVLVAEDAQIRGEAKRALARVIDHDVDHGAERHPSERGDRPVCDTTHCQTFLGTKDEVDVDVVAAVEAPLKATGRRGWLPYSQGGNAPWREIRSLAQVRAAVGAFRHIWVNDGQVALLRGITDKDGFGDIVDTFSCEAVRNRLKLPSCPSSVRLDNDVAVFEGRGAGHSLGLDIEKAKAKASAGAGADAILDEAYPRKRR